MKGSTRAAVALGVGYMLGRHKRLRTAMLMAGAAAVGSKGVGGMAMQRAMKVLGSTEMFGKIAPQLGEITDTVRSDLLPAGKAAAGAALTSRVDNLTGSLQDRAERLRNPGETVAAGAGGAKKAAGRATSTAGRTTSSARRTASGVTGRRAGRRGAAAEPDEDERDLRDEDEYETDDLEPGEPDEYENGEPEDEYEGEPDDEYEDDEDNEDNEDGEARTPRRSAPRRRSPVSRTRR